MVAICYVKTIIYLELIVCMFEQTCPQKIRVRRSVILKQRILVKLIILCVCQAVYMQTDFVLLQLSSLPI